MIYEHLRRNGLMNSFNLNWTIGLRSAIPSAKAKQYNGPPSFFDADDKKHKQNKRDIKDIIYKGNYKDIIHIFKKETSNPHQNLTQARFGCCLRRNSLTEKNKFDLIPYKCKDKETVAYLPPFTDNAKRAVEKLPFKQLMKEEKIKALGGRPNTVNKMSALYSYY